MASIVDTEPASSTALGQAKETPKDADYYMQAFFVTFEVEDRLFRVPSYQFFNESPDFVEIYKLSLHSNDSADPVKLEEVRQMDFRNFLKILYPLSVSLQLSLTKAEWISVLTLSSEWRFLRLREMARDELQRMKSLTSVEKVCLGRQLHISFWVIEGFEELVQRGDTIADDEAIDLDSDFITTSYKLFRMRELRITGRLPSARQKIEEIFKEELERTRREEEGFVWIDKEAEIMRKQIEEEEAERLEAERLEAERLEAVEKLWAAEKEAKEIEEQEKERKAEEEEDARRLSLTHQLKKKKKKGAPQPWTVSPVGDEIGSTSTTNLFGLGGWN